MIADVVEPAIDASAGIGTGPTWLLVGALMLGALALLVAGLLRQAAKPSPAPPTRPVLRCWHGTGRSKCTAPATRIVMVLTGAAGFETHVMCDTDAHQLVRHGRAVDLGPINRRTA